MYRYIFFCKALFLDRIFHLPDTALGNKGITMKVNTNGTSVPVRTYLLNHCSLHDLH